MKRLFSISFLLYLLAACASKPTAKFDYNPNTNFQQFTSYQYSPVTEVSVDSNPVMIHRIQTAIDASIKTKGLTKHEFVDENSADITIKVSFSEQEKQNNSSFNIGLGTSRMGGKSGSSIGVNTNVPISSNENIVTKIIIDISNENQAIWHGSDSYEAKNNLTMKQSNQAIMTTVNNLLANFPPKKNE